MNASLQLSSFSHIFIVSDGPDKGLKFRMSSDQEQIAIGRAQDNDICLVNDLKISRHHATIKFRPEGPFLSNLSQKNVLRIDGEEKASGLLKSGSVFKIGDTKIRYQISSPPNKQAVPSSPSPGAMGPSMSQSASDNMMAPGFEKGSAKKVSNSRKRFYIILGMIGLLAVWLSGQDGPKDTKPYEIRTDEQIRKEIEATRKRKQEKLKELMDSNKNTPQYRSAQSAYLQGFRDYQKGQYGRALQNFQAALSFYPKHEMAQRYIRLARRKQDELIQYKMNRGRTYWERNNFRLCKSEFKSVMIMVRDPNDANYKEAKERYEECDLMLKGRY